MPGSILAEILFGKFTKATVLSVLRRSSKSSDFEIYHDWLTGLVFEPKLQLILKADLKYASLVIIFLVLNPDSN